MRRDAKKKRWLLPDMLQSLSMQAESRRHVRRERGYLLKSKRLPQAVKNHGSVRGLKPFQALKRFPVIFACATQRRGQKLERVVGGAESCRFCGFAKG